MKAGERFVARVRFRDVSLGPLEAGVVRFDFPGVPAILVQGTVDEARQLRKLAPRTEVELDGEVVRVTSQCVELVDCRVGVGGQIVLVAARGE